MADTRPWKLVAPWYRWERQLVNEKRKPRQTRPVFQKFHEADFVRGFVKDPQRSLKFKDDVDRVFNVKLTDAPKLATPPFGGRFTRLYVPNPSEEGQPRVAKEASLVPTGIRKLYLDTHKRYYLVVCELHCDAPGFPTTTPDQVCQAGFVIRRRSFDFPNGVKQEAVKLLQNIMGIQAIIAQFEQTVPVRGIAARRRARMMQKLMAEGAFESKKAALHAELMIARQELRQWKDVNGVEPIHEGWVPGAFDNIGSWQIVEESPQQLIESTFPLYPLFPDPNVPDHSAHGRNIYFGVVPTSSLDTDAHGTARFDHRGLYEIRCFVRRHKPDCPRQNEAPDCPGELVWSEPTESYQLASPTDLIGTSQRPITIQMPDLAELAAQVATLPLNKVSPMKVVQPQSLNFSVNDGKPENGGVGFPQICFFAIPLITIVAFFVLNLFLPIVIFLFGLFFLLRLKFCIPPSIEIDAALKLELEALPPGIDVDAEFDLSLELGFTVSELHADLKAGIADDVGIVAASDINKLNQFSNAALLPLGTHLNEVNSIPTEEAETASLDLTEGLEYEARVEMKVL
jgi:hypothetical protein